LPNETLLIEKQLDVDLEKLQLSKHAEELASQAISLSNKDNMLQEEEKV